MFCKPDKTTPAAKQHNLLRDLLGSEFPELLRDFDIYQRECKKNISPDENETYASADESEEDFSSFESEEDVLADESKESDSSDLAENENFIEQTTIDID